MPGRKFVDTNIWLYALVQSLKKIHGTKWQPASWKESKDRSSARR